MLRLLIGVVATACFVRNACDSARILGVFPAPSISHQVVFRKVTVELAKRGHELVVFTPNPVNDPNLKNYTEIDTRHTYTAIPNFLEQPRSTWMVLKGFTDFTEKITDDVLARPEMQRIVAPTSGEQFDLILVEYLFFDAIYALMARFKVPMVGIVSLPLLQANQYAIGNPPALAYTPGIFDSATDDMNFWGRLSNAFRYAQSQMQVYYDHLRRNDKLVERHFGPNLPSVQEFAKNISIVLVNNHVALSYPRPNLPNIVDIGGIAFDQTLEGFRDSELKTFLDGAVNGFVYFSLGSNAQSKQLPADKLRAIKEAFAELPYRVLWKWELDSCPGKPDNVYTSKWVPQKDVLAHPNIKVFVYQGGLQSTEEVINYGVPVVGIPVFADQEFFIRKLESLGATKRLDINTFSKNELVDAITQVIRDKGYKEKILKIRDLLNDEPMKPLDRAIWWIEYVIRHNGTPHLLTRVRHMPWYQRELLDVSAFVTLIALLLTYIAYKMLITLIKRVSNRLTIFSHSKMKEH